MPQLTRTALKKLLALRPAEWSELVRAQVALIGAQLDIWRRPIGKLVAYGASGPERPLDAASEAQARRLALAVLRAATYGAFRPLCLVRALALSRLLESQGITGSRIRVGVRHEGGFLAHAWVECGELVLGDTEAHTRPFAQLTDVQLSGPR